MGVFPKNGPARLPAGHSHKVPHTEFPMNLLLPHPKIRDGQGSPDTQDEW